MNATNPKTVAPGAETPASLANDDTAKRMKELNATISKLGEEASLGKDSLPKLAHAVVRAAADGLINATDKNAKGESWAHQLYTKYANAESRKALHEHSSGGFKGNVSKLHQLISMGSMTTIDGVEVMQSAYEAREGMKREDGVKVKPAYVFYVEVAREQLKTDKPLDKRTLEAMAVKDEPDAKTLKGELERALKILEGLVTGENKSKLKDTHAKTEEAFHALKDRLATMVMEERRVTLMQQAAKYGLKLA